MKNLKEEAYSSKYRKIYVGDKFTEQEVIDKDSDTIGVMGRVYHRIFLKCKCGDVRSVAIVNKEYLHKPCMSCTLESRGCAYKEISGKFFSSLKYGAKTRNLEVSITPENIYNLFIKQNKKCALSGVELTFVRRKGFKQTASVDRIDSLKGYTKENIQIVHKDINKMKTNFTEDRFIEMCKLVSKYKTI